MGGPSVPSLGFAMGIERIMLLLEAQGTKLPQSNSCDLYIAAMGKDAALMATELVAALRHDGFKAETDICGRGLKAQMKFADKIGAAFSIVLGDDELSTGRAVLKNMKGGERCEIDLNNLSDSLFKALNSSALEELADSVLKQQ